MQTVRRKKHWEREEGVDGQILTGIHNKLGRRVGIVEDNIMLLDLYRKILSSRGHDIVFFAQSGEELARAALEGELSKVQVLITDNRMGGMSGLEAARMIVKYYPDIRIIVASAEDDDLEKEARKSGLVFLRKPFSLLKLADTILQ
jgi:CheY-like chemotaxis protein